MLKPSVIRIPKYLKVCTLACVTQSKSEAKNYFHVSLRRAVLICSVMQRIVGISKGPPVGPKKSTLNTKEESFSLVLKSEIKLFLS